MAGLVNIKDDVVINICPNGTEGEVIELSYLHIQLPKVPPKKDILFSDKPKKDQHWRRVDPPREISSIKTMDEEQRHANLYNGASLYVPAMEQDRCRIPKLPLLSKRFVYPFCRL